MSFFSKPKMLIRKIVVWSGFAAVGTLGGAISGGTPHYEFGSIVGGVVGGFAAFTGGILWFELNCTKRRHPLVMGGVIGMGAHVLATFASEAFAQAYPLGGPIPAVFTIGMPVAWAAGLTTGGIALLFLPSVAGKANTPPKPAQ